MRLSGRKPSSFTRRWTQQQRIALLILVAINIAFFAAQLAVQTSAPGAINEYFGLSSRGIHDAYAWQFFTAMFLHDGPWHLLGNMLVLYLIGRDVESILGQKHFVYLYLAGAIGGEMGHLFLMPENTVLLGASGAVAAVLVAYATILPELELTASLFFILPIRLKTKHLAYGAIFVAAVFLIVDRTGTVSHSAYIGGCFAGWFYAHLLGFGRPSFLQRALHHYRSEAERYRRMTAEQFIAEEVDPLLDKIHRDGLQSLTWTERRTLARAREKMADHAPRP
jgi:membrane associated rhomboid family serine protease